MKRVTPLAAGIAISLVGASFSHAQLAKTSSTKFTSPHGFSITPPPGWIVADNTVTKQLEASVHQKLEKADDTDSNSFAVVIYNSNDKTGGQNINVVATPSPVPLDEAGIEGKIEKLLREQYAKVGISFTKVSVAKKTFGSNAGLVADLESTVSGAPIRQWQVFFPTADQTLVVTCTSNPATFDSVAPAYTQALASMEFPKPNVQHDVPGWVTGAVIGMGVGIGLVIAGRIRAKKK